MCSTRVCCIPGFRSWIRVLGPGWSNFESNSELPHLACMEPTGQGGRLCLRSRSRQQDSRRTRMPGYTSHEGQSIPPIFGANDGLSISRHRIISWRRNIFAEVSTCPSKSFVRTKQMELKPGIQLHGYTTLYEPRGKLPILNQA